MAAGGGTTTPSGQRGAPEVAGSGKQEVGRGGGKGEAVRSGAGAGAVAAAGWPSSTTWWSAPSATRSPSTRSSPRSGRAPSGESPGRGDSAGAGRGGCGLPLGPTPGPCPRPVPSQPSPPPPREVFKAKHRQTGKKVALKKVLMENEKEGVSCVWLRLGRSGGECAGSRADLCDSRGCPRSLRVFPDNVHS